MDQPLPKLTAGNKRTLTWVVALAFLATLTAFAVVNEAISSGEPTAPTPALKVRTLPAVEEGAYRYERRFVGRVEAARESRIGFELGGLLAVVQVDDGDRVARGQVVARLDTARLRARRAELVAALEEAEANRDLAGSTRERVQSARDQNAVSAQALDEANREYQAREAAVQRAAAALAALDVDIDKATLRAPYDAIVAQRLVDDGEVIGGGQPVLTLLERRNPEARIGIARNLVDGIEPGTSHPVEVDGRRYEATVKSVLPQRDDRTRSVEVLFALDAELEQVHRGDLATVAITRTRDEPGFWLPLGALTEGSRGLWSCFVALPLDREVDLPGTHELARRELVILHQEEDRVFVRGTLRDGEQVVREGLHRLAPRLIVEVEEAS